LNDALAGFINPFSGLNLAAAWNANGTTHGDFTGDWPAYPPPSDGMITNSDGNTLVASNGDTLVFANP